MATYEMFPGHFLDSRFPIISRASLEENDSMIQNYIPRVKRFYFISDLLSE